MPKREHRTAVGVGIDNGADLDNCGAVAEHGERGAANSPEALRSTITSWSNGIAAAVWRSNFKSPEAT